MIGNVDRGVAIIRPPGHHATRNEAMGFCFFNNVAISAIYARNRGKKVAIVDFDIHDGNGTCDIINGEPGIHFISIHRYDNGRYYPGLETGAASNVGSNITNFTFNHARGTDEEYKNLFNDKVVPLLQNINPDIILVSAGFDAGLGDPLGNYRVTPNGFKMMVRMMKNVCSTIVLVLEGGYNLDTISNSMAKCVEELLEFE